MGAQTLVILGVALLALAVGVRGGWCERTAYNGCTAHPLSWYQSCPSGSTEDGWSYCETIFTGKYKCKWRYCCDGWTGNNCDQAICRSGCANGGCSSPGQCDCNSGWTGSICDTAICKAGCKRGSCLQKPGACDCSSGWEGDLCDRAICREGCKHGSCTIPNACDCQNGWAGDKCDVAECKVGCVHGTCVDRPFECDCNEGWESDDKGFCDVAICKEGCVNGECANAPGECRCYVGWKGELCDVAKDKCDNGEVCTLGQYCGDVHCEECEQFDNCLQRACTNSTDAECIKCEDGYYVPEGDVKCHECPPGYRCTDGNAFPCGAGLYQPLPKQTECHTCPGNSTHNLENADKLQLCICFNGQTMNVNAEQCELCSEGHVCRNGQETLCPFNTYQNERGRDACLQCPEGTRQNSLGATSIDQCLCGDGNYLVNEECAPCLRGHKCIGGISTPCPETEYQPDVGQTSCLACPATSQAVTAGAVSMLDCACPGGQFLNSTASAPFCQACPPGSSCRTGKVAELCEDGFYQPDGGQSDCIQCPERTGNTGSGATNMDACICANGYHFNNVTEECDSCPKGHWCQRALMSPCNVTEYQDELGKLECKSCPLYSETGILGATNKTECICGKDREWSVNGDACVCIVGTPCWEARRVTSGGSNVGVAAGGAAAGVLVLLVLIALFLVYRKRQREEGKGVGKDCDRLRSSRFTRAHDSIMPDESSTMPETKNPAFDPKGTKDSYSSIERDSYSTINRVTDESYSTLKADGDPYNFTDPGIAEVSDLYSVPKNDATYSALTPAQADGDISLYAEYAAPTADDDNNYQVPEGQDINYTAVYSGVGSVGKNSASSLTFKDGKTPTKYATIVQAD